MLKGKFARTKPEFVTSQFALLDKAVFRHGCLGMHCVLVLMVGVGDFERGLCGVGLADARFGGGEPVR